MIQSALFTIYPHNFSENLFNIWKNAHTFEEWLYPFDTCSAVQMIKTTSEKKMAIFRSVAVAWCVFSSHINASEFLWISMNFWWFSLKFVLTIFKSNELTKDSPKDRTFYKKTFFFHYIFIKISKMCLIPKLPHIDWPERVRSVHAIVHVQAYISAWRIQYTCMCMGALSLFDFVALSHIPCGFVHMSTENAQ